jgi:hypothetical protein
VPENGDTPDHLLAADLRDDELAEVLDLAFKGVAEATRFRDKADGANGGKGGAGVGGKAKRAGGSRPRKR